MDWVDFVPDRERGMAFVNSITKLLVPYNARNFLADSLLASQNT